MRRRISRLLGCVLLAVAAGFLWFALHHPEASWPGWFPEGPFYAGYLLVTAALLVAPWKDRRTKKERRSME